MEGLIYAVFYTLVAIMYWVWFLVAGAALVGVYQLVNGNVRAAVVAFVLAAIPCACYAHAVWRHSTDYDARAAAIAALDIQCDPQNPPAIPRTLLVSGRDGSDFGSVPFESGAFDRTFVKDYQGKVSEVRLEAECVPDPKLRRSTCLRVDKDVQPPQPPYLHASFDGGSGIYRRLPDARRSITSGTVMQVDLVSGGASPAKTLFYAEPRYRVDVRGILTGKGFWTRTVLERGYTRYSTFEDVMAATRCEL